MYNVILQAWIDYCKAVLAPEITVCIAEESVGQDSPRPPKPYVTLKIIAGPGLITRDDELRFNEDSPEKIHDLVGQRSYTISMKAYGENFNDILNDISTYLDDDDKREILRDAAKIAVTNKGTVVDISGQLPTGFEKRASLDIFFNSSQNKETQVGIIEGVEIAGQLTTDGDKVITTKVTI